MTVQLVSSNPTKKKLAVVCLAESRNMPLRYFLSFDSDHLSQLKKAGAILFKVEEKVALLAAFKNKDPMNIFIPNLCIDIPRKMTPGIALAAEALRRGMSTVRCGLYVEQFPRWQEVPFLAQIGLQMLLFREGHTDRDSVALFTKNFVQITRVDV